ncbi:bifunctional 4-hydroxy-2-oxoglutarate aldolase/2-dehydro-3-deoxy-phosphogluconate aldolase [Streptococcus oriscaviae]|uniref:Bifunctional 4-hydroxy-2-oxoglutarate aldolase/2-dehydro-3-deoxy-phosphogluconate aldolase n=1 Tax=Streptococcus oriscaviae TaxID=2781599 RepID=A0ABX7YKV2_9STRE|nr:bifunctional 4-hydroxy-2-oxoglutarate aldolase/2-dehydro-3-deoxy-phosphogluconate aldolase [Streptococcus oriscaviae]QUE54252.1 bifunctional 4-hydroxy-2-oxoglutarate aldolase/2-dehydro-3-deoxy-phosphogluconate aldolase [Streptococcus oriscaviae]
MSQSQILSQLRKQGLVVVVRGDRKEDGVKASQACISGGISAIEVAYTNPDANLIIADLRQTYQENPDVLIGAGTVLDPVTARQAIMAGASFIVAPSFNEEVARLCHLYAVPYIPGCMTLTEITRALEAGCEMVKLFPASVFGPSYVSAIKAPLPQVSIMVTGGVNLGNASTWFAAGVDAIGVGGEFNQLAAQGQFDRIQEMAAAYAGMVVSS